VIFVVCEIAVLIYPNLFMSGFVGGLGTMTYYMFFLLLPIRVVAEVLVPLRSLIQISQNTTMVFIIVSFILFLPFLNILREKGLNQIQSHSLHAIEPDRILQVIRPYEKILKDKYKALAVKLNLDNRLSYGVKEELIKLYAEENKSRSEKVWVLTFLTGLAVFIFQSLGQPFLEDALYSPFIKPLLCRFNQVFCK